MGFGVYAATTLSLRSRIMKRCVSSESRETRFSNDESQATTAKQPDERLIWGPYKTFRLDTGSISYLWSDETTLQSRTLSFRVEGPMRLGSLLLLRPFDLLQRHQRRQLGLLPANGHKNDNNTHNSTRGDKLFIIIKNTQKIVITIQQ